jgi:hypothetical protein
MSTTASVLEHSMRAAVLALALNALMVFGGLKQGE